MNEVTLAAGIVAVVEAIKGYVPQVNGVVTLLVALVLGAVVGYLHLLNTPDLFTGLFIGAMAVGVHTVASTVAGK